MAVISLYCCFYSLYIKYYLILVHDLEFLAEEFVRTVSPNRKLLFPLHSYNFSKFYYILTFHFYNTLICEFCKNGLLTNFFGEKSETLLKLELCTYSFGSSFKKIFLSILKKYYTNYTTVIRLFKPWIHEILITNQAILTSISKISINVLI